jgi:hypothetical protein
MQPTVVDLIASADRGDRSAADALFTALYSELQRYKEWRLDDPADVRTDSSASESQRPATGKRREYLRDYLPLMRRPRVVDRRAKRAEAMAVRVGRPQAIARCTPRPRNRGAVRGGIPDGTRML